MDAAADANAGEPAIPTDLPLRNDLIGEEPYGAPQLDVPVCLNVNENPYAPKADVVESIAQRIREAARSVNRYPDREHEALRQAFCDYLKAESDARLQPAQVWGANGSNEIMLQLFMAFGGPGRTALAPAPTYSMYPEYARDTFTAWQTVPRNDDFTVNVVDTIQAMHELQPAMVVLTSPNNPTGTPLPIEDLKQILEASQSATVAGAQPGTHPIVVVDEAYIEFRDPGTPSATTLVNDYHNLAVSRTMSKAFAFAGSRVGYVAADKGIIDCMRIVRMPYHLSAITQAAALAAFDHTDEQLAEVNHLRQTREQTAQWLTTQTYKGKALQVMPSQSNFILFGGHLAERELIFEQMLERGVLIRVVGPEGWLRVCMGTDEEMAQFRAALTASLRAAEQMTGYTA
ncbi:histidinol-phosphate transaminase [Bifidobacterium dolichotidis]|nr:histidinol-phosphate transaminase [Bifidobacterium dolichotidis]